MKAPTARERVRIIDTATGAPTNRVTEPIIVTSPRTPDGQKTSGLMLSLYPIAGSTLLVPAAPSGLTLTLYRLVPTLGLWTACYEYTGLQLGQQLVTFDVGAGAALYPVFTLATANGTAGLGIAEVP
jgi:hypothetical protein